MWDCHGDSSRFSDAELEAPQSPGHAPLSPDYVPSPEHPPSLDLCSYVADSDSGRRISGGPAEYTDEEERDADSMMMLND
ncbi:hypothetical protein Tco_0890771 [Tanacetum coccineum]|uniref:Uncharacterized protein n=1 Tax=Tanacetum coccineum TaxID=301880 RepID=A0ABQ5C6J6_9ASTR